MEGLIIGLVLLAVVACLVFWSRAQNQRKRDDAAAYAAAAAAEEANPLPEAGSPPKQQKKKKKKKKGSATEAVVDDQGKEEALAIGRGEAEAGEILESRAQHYAFGHRLFRDVMRDANVLRATMALAADAKADDAIEKLWEGAGKMALAAEGKRDVIPGGPPKVRLLDDGLLVRMPPPRRTTECLFIVVLLDGDGIRYFTLEKAPPILSKNPFTVCEWRDEAHLNMGNDAVPDPTEDAFLAFARSRLDSAS